MQDECVICKAPLKYLEQDILMECAVCHKKENSKTMCVNGHYVCDECHTKGMDSIFSICLQSNAKNPVNVLEQLKKRRRRDGIRVRVNRNDDYISMGCNVQCPVLPGKRMENWGLEEPTGQSDEVFLEIAEKIKEKVLELKIEN